MSTQTPTQRLADHLLGGGLEDFIRSRRPHRSWRLIARDLYEATSHYVDVTSVTVAAWFPDVEDSDEDVGESQLTVLSRAG